MARSMMECGICLDDIKYGAKVCKGCHAKIEYGAPWWVFIICLAVVCVATYYSFFGLAHVGMWLGMLDPNTNVHEIGRGGTAPYILLGMFGFSFIVTTIIYGVFIEKIFKNHVSFKRTTIELK
ncbi:hypothetical protein [Ignatzschineria sp. LJL83]